MGDRKYKQIVAVLVWRCSGTLGVREEELSG